MTHPRPSRAPRLSRRVAPLAALATAAVLVLAPAVNSPADAAAKKYSNCTAMHRDYKHGVGKPGARDKTSGTRVTNFKVSRALYDANKGSDRDKDGIACEA